MKIDLCELVSNNSITEKVMITNPKEDIVTDRERPKNIF